MPMPSPATLRAEALRALAASRAWGLAWLLCAPAWAQPPGLPQAEAVADTPRAYGYSVGDVVQRRVQLQLPPDWQLDLDALPRTRRPGQAIELRRAELQGSLLLLEYQIFLAPTEVRTLELPVLQLRLRGPAAASAGAGPAASAATANAAPDALRETTLRVDAWPVTVAPLVPLAVSPREGLGEMRPDVPAPLLATQPHQQRLLAYALAALLLGLGLWQRLYGLPFSARRQRPFAQAWRQLQRLSAARGTGTDAAAPRRQAFQLLHQALNRQAGQVLFAGGLPAFVQQQPAFAPLQGALAEFFARSEAEFFAPANATQMAGQMPAGIAAQVAAQVAAQDATLAWLRELARRLRAAERSA